MDMPRAGRRDEAESSDSKKLTGAMDSAPDFYRVVSLALSKTIRGLRVRVPQRLTARPRGIAREAAAAAVWRNG